MGAAMTILSFSLLSQMAPVRQLRMSDLEPAKVWAGLTDRIDRASRLAPRCFIENLKFVYQIQTTLREWQQQNAEELQSASQQAGSRTEDGRAQAASESGLRFRPEECPVEGQLRIPRGEDVTRGTYMNCQNHPEVTGHGILPQLRQADLRRMPARCYGTVYCAEHIPAPPPAPGVRW
jgi:hypothetical protein